MHKLKIFLLSLAGCFSLEVAWADTQVKINADEVIAHLSPTLYGSGMEDVNHEVYGGIYSQRIFGESFEEAPIVEDITDFTAIPQVWKKAGTAVYVYSTPAAWLYYNKKQPQKGFAEMMVRYDGLIGEAGFALVSRTGDMATARGYECYLNAWSRQIVFKRLDGKRTTIQKIPYLYEPTANWNKLRVEWDGAHITVRANGQEIFHYFEAQYTSEDRYLGLATSRGDVAFDQLNINGEQIAFNCKGNGVSGMWQSIGNKGIFRHEATGAFTGDYAQYMESAGGEEVGVVNMGLNRWGIATQKGKAFQGRIYIKGKAERVKVALQSADGQKEYASASLQGISDTWQPFTFTLKPNTTDAKARFAVILPGQGRVWLDQAMLEPVETYKGLPVRKDVALALEEEGLNFLRFGGSVVNTLDYRTGLMVGPREKRSPYRGSWYRYASHGFSIIEFVQLAKALGQEPSFALNMEDNPDDVAYLIEYLNGSTATKGGLQRAQDGHPEPYAVKYVELGNEEVIQKDTPEGYRHYIERFNILTEAMRRVDPDLKFVTSAWWRPNSPNMEATFRALDGKVAYWDYHPVVDDSNFVNARKVEKELEQMQVLFHRWNPQTKVKCAIFEENGDSHGVRRMLEHIITLNAVRRNGDFVLTSCQANALEPYKQNDNGWNQGQIFMTPDKVWHQPTSYAQQMASKWHEPLCVREKVHGSADIDVSATLSEDKKTLVLHIANTSAQSEPLHVDIQSFGPIKQAEALVLYGEKEADNTPEHPTRIAPQKQKVSTDGNLTVKPYSYTLLVYKTK